MNVIYLSWGETPRSYGVFGSQVLAQFVYTKRLTTDSSFYFLSGLPILNSGLVREKIRYLHELKEVKKRLHDIQFSLIPIFAPQHFVNSSRLTFSLMHGISHLFLYSKLKKIKPDIIHCRSYHAAWAAIKVREKYNLNYKVLFDGRGLWPEEVSLKKGFLKNSDNYKYLKNIELEILTKCDASVTVSDTMHSHYLELGSKNDNRVYLSADTLKMKTELKYRVSADTIRFCYVGSLDENSWHKPSELFKLYDYLRSIFPKTVLTIVTTSDLDPIKHCFKSIPTNEVFYTNTKNVQDLMLTLSNQDFGLLSYLTPSSTEELTLGKMVLAVKTVEYFAAGLPVICNKFCGGAANLIEKFNLGLTYDPNKISIQPLKLLDMLEINNRKRIQDFATDNFDYHVNAKKYIEIYQNLVLFE